MLALRRGPSGSTRLSHTFSDGKESNGLIISHRSLALSILSLISSKLLILLTARAIASPVALAALTLDSASYRLRIQNDRQIANISMACSPASVSALTLTSNDPIVRFTTSN
jgi:hypothetical protein